MSNLTTTATVRMGLEGPATTLATVDPALIHSLYLTVINNYCSVGAFMLLLWDISITIGNEIEFMWLQPGQKLGKSLFFLNRYLPPLDIAILINTYVNPGVDRRLCLPWFSVDNWLSVFSLAVVEVIMLLRTYALWNRSRRILGFLVIMFLICTFATCSAVLYFTITAYSVDMEGGVRPCVNAFKELNIVQVVWGSTIMFDSTIVILMLIKIFPMVQEGTSSELFQSMYEDGFLYFAVLFCASTANLFVFALAPDELKLMLVTLQRTLFSMLASRLVLNLRGALFKRTLATTIALDSAVNRRAGDVTPPTGPTSAANTQGTGTNTLSTTTCKGSPSKAFASSSSSSLSRMASTNHTGLSESRSKRHATRASVDLGNKRTGRNTRQHTLLQAPSKYEWSEEYRDVELQVHTGTASCGAGDLFQFDDLTTLNFSDFQLANTHPHARTSSQSRLSDDDDERQSEDGTIRSSIPYVRSPVSNLSDMQTTSEPSTRHLRFHSLGGSRDVPSRLSRGIVLDLEAGPSAPPVHTRSRRTFSL